MVFANFGSLESAVVLVPTQSIGTSTTADLKEPEFFDTKPNFYPSKMLRSTVIAGFK